MTIPIFILTIFPVMITNYMFIDLFIRPIMIPYHTHNLPIKRIRLNNNWSLLHQDPVVGESFSSPPLVAYRGY